MSAAKTDQNPDISISTEQSGGNRNSELFLSDISLQDQSWGKHRAFADTVQRHYAGSKFERYSERIFFCSQLLEFGLHLADDDILKLKLRNSKFCRVRHCPICQWRRSLMWKAKAYQVLPKILEKYPSHRWLFVTLTQKNIPITELRNTLTEMNKGFKRLVDRKAFPAIGWLRSTEVTRGKNRNAHPHFHCLLMVPASYFSHGYMKQSEWMELWRESMRLDYNPVMDVQAVKKGVNPSSLVPELLKYCTKESDMVADREWLLDLTVQLHNMRAIATGGVLRQYLRELEEEPRDLIGEGCEQLFFEWQSYCQKYNHEG
jgi:plasmid rolling circle replication initiator protein Rep